MKSKKSFKEVWEVIKNNWAKNKKGYLRAWLIFAIFSTGALFLLGPGYFLISYAFILALRYYFSYWGPPYKTMKWLMGQRTKFLRFFQFQSTVFNGGSRNKVASYSGNVVWRDLFHF